MMETRNLLPDPSSHRGGWVARKINGQWHVGMEGNLDTVHDAVLTLHTGRLGGDEEARITAEWIAETYTAACAERGPLET